MGISLMTPIASLNIFVPFGMSGTAQRILQLLHPRNHPILQALLRSNYLVLLARFQPTLHYHAKIMVCCAMRGSDTEQVAQDPLLRYDRPCNSCSKPKGFGQRDTHEGR